MRFFFDFAIAIILIIFLFPPMLIIAVMIILRSDGPIIYWSDRVGKENKIFRMPKFRTMKINTPDIATHLMHGPDDFLSPGGKFLRRTSLDELPQLFIILTGNMSFVGPRPALFNQYDLIALRTSAGIDKIKPGITGWAQINGRDELSIEEKVAYDLEYLENHSFWLDLKILWLTLLKVINNQDISH